MDKSIDLLNRDGYVAQINNILKLAFEMNKPICLALSGCWGSGKTFILNMLMNNNDNNNYIFLKYDAWEKDFYDEPLIAMLYSFACQLNELKAKPKFLEIIGELILDESIELLYYSINIISKKVLGFEVVNLSKRIVKKYKKIEQKNKINLDFNNLLGVEEAKKLVKNALEELSNKVKLVILVDEIDRCLPTYSIKVLERLHHFIIGNNNTNVIVALDKIKLGNVIGKMYNDDNFDYNKYFQKFFDNTLLVNEGNNNDKFDSRYYDYSNLFTNEYAFISKNDIDIFKKNIFGFGNIREANMAVEKAFFIHKLLFSNEKFDLSFQCIEILLSYLSILKKENGNPIEDFFSDIMVKRTKMFNKETQMYFNEIRCEIHKVNEYIVDRTPEVIIKINDLWSLLKYIINKLNPELSDSIIKPELVSKKINIEEYTKKIDNFYFYAKIL